MRGGREGLRLWVKLGGEREGWRGGEFVGGGWGGGDGRGCAREVGVFGEVEGGVMEGGVGVDFMGDGGEGGEGGGNEDRLEGGGGEVC